MAFPALGTFRQTLALAAMAAACVAALADGAEARPDTRRMSCVQAQGLVARSGAVVMTYGPYLYDRFVANTGFCDYEEEAATRRVPTVDTPACPLRYCRPATIFVPGFGFDR